MKAIWNGAVIAQSDATVVVEGNHYFPAEALDRQYFRDATQTTVCPWKGTANYLDVIVGDKVNPGAAWTYHAPSEAAKQIKDYVAFWRGVEVTS